MSELETKYSDFKERQSKRKKAFYIFMSLILVFVIFGAYLYLENMFYYYVWINVGVIGSAIGFFYTAKRPWFRETIETNVFVKFYEANKRAQLCLTKDGTSQSNLELAHNKAKDATLILKRYSTKLSSESSSRLVKNEIAEPYKELAKNLETRILPRILQRKNLPEIQGILCALAFSFSEVYAVLHVSDIISRNKELKKYEPINVEEPISTFRIILAKDSARFFLSFFISFLGLITILWIHSVLANTNLLEEFNDSSYFLQFVLGVIAGGLGTYAVIRQKT